MIKCPICSYNSILLDSVDFNKSTINCIDYQPSGVLITYHYCERCGFTWAPEFNSWSDNDFLIKIYNDDYINVDSDYIKERPEANATFLLNSFKEMDKIKHLDYGGGNGVLTNCLKQKGWNSTSYDPFPKNTGMKKLGKFDFITAFEVFEHVPNVNQLMVNILTLMHINSFILFSTLVSDNIEPKDKTTWWYTAPRNGHISLFTKKSLIILADRYGLKFESQNYNLHCFYKKTIPSWVTKSKS